MMMTVVAVVAVVAYEWRWRRGGDWDGAKTVELAGNARTWPIEFRVLTMRLTT